MGVLFIFVASSRTMLLVGVHGVGTVHTGLTNWTGGRGVSRKLLGLASGQLDLRQSPPRAAWHFARPRVQGCVRACVIVCHVLARCRTCAPKRLMLDRESIEHQEAHSRPDPRPSGR